jgi:hypothetical protein
MSISRIAPSNAWWRTTADPASPVKAASRRRRGPKASLYRASWSAKLVPPALTADGHFRSLGRLRRPVRDPIHRDDPGKRAPN